MASNGDHDRRGYHFWLQSWLVAIVLSLGILATGRWFVGIGLSLLSMTCFLTLERMSAPPENRPSNFIPRARRVGRRRPTLVMLGDGLTHGTQTSSITPDVPIQLCKVLGMEPPKMGQTFADPVWVVNAGQNGIASEVVLKERLNMALGCYPEYILVWLGMEECKAIYSDSWARSLMKVNKMQVKPSLDTLERNLNGILDFIAKASPSTKVALMTLPPMGEDLRSAANQIVQQANDRIVQVARKQDVGVVEVYDRLAGILEKTRRRSDWSLGVLHRPVHYLMNFLLYNVSVLFSRNLLSTLFYGYNISADGIYLNERGGQQVVALVADWLVEQGVAKAIAVKS